MTNYFPIELSSSSRFLSNFSYFDSNYSSLKEPGEYDYDEETYYKAIADLYSELPNEAIIVNTICAALVGLAILLPCILKCDAFRKGLEPEADVESDED